MRKRTLSLALAAVLSLAAVPAHAFFEANLAGGYTTLAPSSLNDQISGTGSSAVTPINSGGYVALDAGISLLPFLKIDPRVSAVFAGQGKSTFGTTAYTVDGNIVPLELGVSADLGAPMTGISIRAGAWAGYGMATVTVGSDNGGVKGSTLYQGSAFTAELLGAARYSLAPFLSLSLEAGYRLANVTELTEVGGKAWKNSKNDNVGFDFSGANLGGGLVFSF